MAVVNGKCLLAAVLLLTLSCTIRGDTTVFPFICMVCSAQARHAHRY